MALLSLPTRKTCLPELVEAKKLRMAEPVPIESFRDASHRLSLWYGRKTGHKVLFWLILLLSAYALSHHWAQFNCTEPGVIFGGCASYE